MSPDRPDPTANAGPDDAAPAGAKVPCSGCGAAILPDTAERNRGRCMRCAGKSGKGRSRLDKAGDVAEGIGCGIRLLIATLCGGVVAAAVYAPVAKSYPGIAVFAAIGGFVAGFVLGLLAPYIRLLLDG